MSYYRRICLEGGKKKEERFAHFFLIVKLKNYIVQQSLFTFHIGSCYRAMRHCSVGHLCLFSKSVSSRVFGAVRHRVSRLSKRRFHTCYLYCMILCATLYRGICCEKHHCEAIAMLDSRQMTAPQRRITLTVLLDSFSSRRKWARNSGN